MTDNGGCDNPKWSLFGLLFYRHTNSSWLFWPQLHQQHWNQKRKLCEGHTGDNMDVSQETLIFGSRITLYEVKHKPVGAGLATCVWAGNVSLCDNRCEIRWARLCVQFVGVCVCVCACVCLRVFVCMDVFTDMSGDICCAAGWELSTVGLQEPQTKKMKAGVMTWTSGTRH